MSHLVRTAVAPLHTPRTALEHRLIATLWSARSPLWSGYIDFQGPGHYLTHWGFGTWRSLDDQRVLLRNSYDAFFFEMVFDDDLVSYETVRTNHSHDARLVGDLVWDYGRQEPPSSYWRTR